MKRITLCGSTKFKKTFEEWNKRLTLQENIVYSVAFFNHADGLAITKEQKTILDQVHFKKIDHSDEIFVLDVDGYIGESTRNEINYAIKSGKNIRYLSKECPDWKENA